MTAQVVSLARYRDGLYFEPPVLRWRGVRVSIDREASHELAAAIRETLELPGMQIALAHGFVVRSFKVVPKVLIRGFGIDVKVPRALAAELAFALARYARRGTKNA